MMKYRFSFLFLFALCALALPAQIKLVGGDIDPSNFIRTAIRWDFETGNITDSIVDPAVQGPGAWEAFDAFRNRYCYFGDTSLRMVQFDLGTVLNAPIVPPVKNPEFDMSDGRYIGIEDSLIYDSTSQLVGMYMHMRSFDLSTGAATTILSLSGHRGNFNNAHAFDSNSGTFFQMTRDSANKDRLLKIVTKLNIQVDTVPLLNRADQITGLGYDNLHDLLYALILADSSGYYELVRIDPATGVTTFEASFPQLITAYTVGFDQNTSTYVIAGMDVSFLTSFYAYHLPTDSLTIRPEPVLGVDGPLVDNAAFAASHYPPIGIPEAAAERLHVFPNPVSTTLHVADLRRAATYEVLDLQGRVCAAGSTSGEVPVEKLSDGLYNLRMVLPDGARRTARFMKCAD